MRGGYVQTMFSSQFCYGMEVGNGTSSKDFTPATDFLTAW